MSLMKRFVKTAAFGLFALTISAAEAAPLGPVYPAPGGNSWSPAGDVGLAGGATWTYTITDFGAFDQLWWGPANVGSSMDGGGLEAMSLNSLAGAVATWTGMTSVFLNTGSSDVATRFTATIISGAPGGWVTSGSVGILGGEPQAVAEVVSNDFVVNLLFEADIANFGVGFNPFRTEFDNAPTVGGSSSTSFTGQFYYTENVPNPGAAALLLGGLGGLAFVRKKSR